MAEKDARAERGGTGGGARPARRRGKARPALLAGLDIGTTAVRMHIAEHRPEEEEQLRVIEELTSPIATGADTFTHGHVRPETLFSICDILKSFMRLMREYGVEHCRLIAAAAVRDAANREILVDRIRHNSGLELEVLDAVEESRLVYQALLPWLRRHQGSYSMALNLGGGSTEIMILRGDDLQIGGSRRLGTSRLFYSAGTGGGNIRMDRLQAMAANLVRSTRDAYQDYNITHFFLANRILYRAFRDVPEAVRHENDFVIASDALRERIRLHATQSPLEIASSFNMGLAEVESLLPAMMILDSFMEAIEVGEITFTNIELLTGLLLEMGMNLRGENPLMAFRPQMIRSARAIGEQYLYDRAHARVVTHFALILFDALAGMLNLNENDRLLLELAAVLHDIGMFVSERHHHRHSAYLVKWSDIVGLNETDRILTAQIVYFHRKETPSREHPEFMALSKQDRLRVNKIAAILRLADVLDRAHAQNVKDLRAEIVDKRLVVYLRIASDLGIILDALPHKADLLEQVSGLQVVLRREIPQT